MSAMVVVIVGAWLAFRPRAEEPHAPPADSPHHRIAQQPVAPPPKTFTELAVELLDAMAPEDIAELADVADAALDFGEPSITIHAVQPDGSKKALVLPAAFLEDLLDQIVVRRPDLQAMIDAPRERPHRKRSARSLPPALASGLTHRVAMHYRDANGAETDRRVTVRNVLGRDGAATHINGRCHDRRASRSFRLDRIAELQDEETGEVLATTAAIEAWATDLVAARSGTAHG
ncbi:WYL domain-containing protein [Elioraea sp.]|uniref:WYL domain-containing protein n=1 Tax=Elioraea sp. TaxID=2185103 RepID=UPI0025B7D376|nr:WYL domain-containing protein [Elioraea sp.]